MSELSIMEVITAILSCSAEVTLHLLEPTKEMHLKRTNWKADHFNGLPKLEESRGQQTLGSKIIHHFLQL